MVTNGAFRRLALAALCAVAASSPARAQPDSMDAIFAARSALEQLAWLSGAWEAEHEQLEGVPLAWTEEIWSEPRGAMMIGYGRRGQGLRLGTWELLRIQGDEDGRLALHAQVDGDRTVAFPLVRSAAGEAVFENPAHDYPQRIAYRRAGDRLTATISLIDGSDPRSWEFRRRAPGEAVATGR